MWKNKIAANGNNQVKYLKTVLEYSTCINVLYSKCYFPPLRAVLISIILIISTWFVHDHSRPQFEQGDVGSVGSQHQFLQVPLLFGRLVGSLCVDTQDDLVGWRPFGPAVHNTFINTHIIQWLRCHMIWSLDVCLFFKLPLWPLQTVCSSKDPLSVNQSSSTEMNSHAVWRRRRKFM